MIAIIPDRCFAGRQCENGKNRQSKHQNGLRAAFHGQGLRGLTFHKSPLQYTFLMLKIHRDIA
ncbi:MAG: hypothetical protein KGQ32_08060, partial [Xanthomonadaceae bacterium]|nr:hypothetical protein [Xanthomonadaceae bacterium]